MPLFTKKKENENSRLGLYASADSRESIPKYRMPGEAQDMRTVYHLVHDELSPDSGPITAAGGTKPISPCVITRHCITVLQDM
jgi:hypothetical protein